MGQTRLMTTPPQFVLSRLSRQLYMDFLAKARTKGFAFVRFQDFLPGADPLPRRYIVLRHDIDFSPGYSLEMAELEHAAGVASTYFVLVDGQFYNPLDREVVGQLRRIHALGHEIGLHYAVSSSVDTDLGRDVAFRLRVLSSIADAPIRAFSQHDPVNAGMAAVVLPPGHEPCVDATHLIRDHELLYVSDSAMMWRRFTFDSALDQDRNLCLLAHPHSWLHPQDDYVAMIREFQAAETAKTMERYDRFADALVGYYTRRLAEGI